MTIKEQFQKWHYEVGNPTIEEDVNDLEKIADGFAIKFGLWLTKKGNYNINNWNKPMSEMLEIFKKEFNI